MSINSVNSLSINNPLLNNSMIENAKNAADDVSGFAEMLKRTADNAVPNATPESQPLSSRTVKIDKTDKLYEQCVELEIFLVKSLLNSMRSTIQKSGLIDEGFAGKMYEDMLYDEYARSLAVNANLGLAEMAYLDLTGQRGKTVVH